MGNGVGKVKNRSVMTLVDESLRCVKTHSVFGVNFVVFTVADGLVLGTRTISF